MRDNIEYIKKYWDDQPCNSKHSNKPIGSLEYFEEQKEKRFFVEPHIANWAQFYSYQGKKVLELGCGIGADAVEFVKAGAEYIGTEISEESLNLTKKRFDVYNLEGEFFLSDGIDLSFINKPVDLVYSYGVLHHFPDIQPVINNIHEVLTTAGEFKFMVYNTNSWKFAMIRAGLDQYEAQAACPYAKTYTQEEIYDLLAGKFRIERIRQSHCFMYNIEKYKQGIYELEPWFAAMSPRMREAMREYLGWHWLVKASKI